MGADVNGTEVNSSLNVKNTRMASFTFLNAVRDRVDVKEVERLRFNGNTDELVCEWKECLASDVLYPIPEALRFAIMYGHILYARYLLENYAKEALSVVTCCPLMFLAVRLNHEAMVDLLCAHGKNVKMSTGKLYIDSAGCDLMEGGKTALHTAVELGHRGCTKILLRHGANHRLVDSDGQSVLERACVRFKSKPSFSVLMCIVDVIKCETQMQPKTIGLLNELYKRWPYSGCFSEIPLALGVSSLMHLSRCSLRASLHRRLPNAISELPIPNIAKEYLDVSYTPVET